MKFWQATRKPQRRSSFGLDGMPNSGRAINLTDSEMTYRDRWRA